ncbi:MAG TPA: ABC transporter substrate-binding protein [Actinomycetota bacterium]|jgi:iron complex transport system substrate-binding protein|nr:ABC transporter substrate-binding protein [Actinomycetota bacterium]
MPTWSRPVAVALALVLTGTACREAQREPLRSPPAEAEFPLTLTDDEGVEVTIDSEPQRIVTFAPSHTETLFALGLGDRVVGVSGPFDDFPPEAEGIEPVAGAGGTEPNVEKVVALEPDLLLTAFIGGEWKNRLRELGTPVFTTLAASFDDALEDIETIGRLTGASEEAHKVSEGMEAEVQQITGRAQEAGPVTCFLELSDLFTVGPGALEFDLLERAGCEPVTADAAQPYPQWSVERLVRDDPDVFLASEYGQPAEQVADRPGIRNLRAVREGRLYLVDGDLISRPGPRLVDGIAELAEALHPDLF